VEARERELEPASGQGRGQASDLDRAAASEAVSIDRATASRLLSQTKPSYTADAMNRKIQGSVWLELVVTREGRTSEIRVARSIDPGGLDEEAVKAVRQWRFDPGRLAGAPVDVLVTVVMDFWIR
jgi:periplasmic protein TonB